MYILNIDLYKYFIYINNIFFLDIHACQCIYLIVHTTHTYIM